MIEVEIAAVRTVVPSPKVLKVILESAALSEDQLKEACLCAERAGADFVKTSTGYHPAGGASLLAILIMKSTVPRLGIKVPEEEKNAVWLYFRVLENNYHLFEFDGTGFADNRCMSTSTATSKIFLHPQLF